MTRRFRPEDFAGLAQNTDDAAKAASLLNRELDPLTIESAASWARQCYNPPPESELIMEALNGLLGFYGVEAIRGRWVDSYHGDIVATYLNSGDTYAQTVILNSESGEFHLGSYGDFVEAMEDEEDEGDDV